MKNRNDSPAPEGCTRRRVRRWFRRADPAITRRAKKEQEVSDLISTLWGMDFWVMDRAPWPEDTSFRRWWIGPDGPNRIFVRIAWRDVHPALATEQDAELVYTLGQCKMVGAEGILKSAIHDALRLRSEKILFVEANT
jgi:hypothetical protein